MTMKSRRIGMIILGTIFILIFGWVVLYGLNMNRCMQLSEPICQVIWGNLMAAIIGGILLAEILIATRKKWIKRPDSAHDIAQAKGKPSQLSQWFDKNWYVWVRPFAWRILAALLIACPLIVQGAFVLTFAGTIIGFFLDGVIRALANRMPSKARDNTP